MEQLAIILALAVVGGLVARLFKQPPLLGYLMVGVLLAGTVGKNGDVGHMVDVMGQLGVTFLLFLVGLELQIGELKKMGRVVVIAAVAQMMLITLVGAIVLGSLGVGWYQSGFVALVMSFSSTIVVIKLLSEKRDLQSLHGKLAVSMLLLQDFVAIIVMVVLGGMGGGFSVWAIVAVVVKVAVLVWLAVFVVGRMWQKILEKLTKSGEIMLLVIAAWCIGLAAVAASKTVGLSAEIGGFLAGLALANSSQSGVIISKVKSLRDFFLTLFFVSLGASISFDGAGAVLGIGVVLAIFVLMVKFVVVMLVLISLGYGKRTGFLVGLYLGQVSEFSLVIGQMAVRAGVIDSRVMVVLTLVAAITMVVSTYLATAADWLYRACRPVLNWLGGVQIRERPEHKSTGQIVLIGHSRTGSKLLPVLLKLGREVQVIDFDPNVVKAMNADGVEAVVGDISDLDFVDELGVFDAYLVVSTVSDVNDNVQLVREAHARKNKPLLLVTAVDAEDARRLYDHGADYVLIPHMVGGEYLANVIETLGAKHLYKLAQWGQGHAREIRTW